MHKFQGVRVDEERGENWVVSILNIHVRIVSIVVYDGVCL